MVKPTLTNPDVVIEVPSTAVEGQATERPSSYLFVKTFNYGEKSVKFFTSVTVSKDGLEVVVSNHIEEANRIKNAFGAGKLLFLNKETVRRASSTDPELLRQFAEVDNIINDVGASGDKGTTKISNEQKLRDIEERQRAERETQAGLHCRLNGRKTS